MKLRHALLSTACVLSMSLTSIYANDQWDKPTVAYGGGITYDQLVQTQSLFQITDPSTINEIVVDSYDIEKYLQVSAVSTSSLISSVMVQKTEDTGVVVDIVTPDMIQNITSQQYANAAITAGITNCEIRVASVVPVTGESALTGVYKAFEANGEIIDTDRTEVAQEELEITNDINSDNEENNNYSPEVLEGAIVEIKQQMAEIKKNSGSISEKDIEKIVNQVLEKYGLTDLLSKENIQAIIDFAKKYANTGAIDSQEVLEQLSSLSKTFSSDVQDLIQTAKENGWWDKLVSTVKDFINSLYESVK